MKRRFCVDRSVVKNIVSSILLISFSFNIIQTQIVFAEPVGTNSTSLSPWTVTEIPHSQRDLIAALYKGSRQLWIANSDRYKTLLENHGADALLLPSGRYLISPEIADNTLLLIRAIIHEDYEVLMQREAMRNPARYQRLKATILSSDEIMMLYNDMLGGQGLPGSDNNVVFNDLIARAFELYLLIEKHIVHAGDELTEAERRFERLIRPFLLEQDSLGRYKNFSQTFFNEEKKTAVIRHMLDNGSIRLKRAQGFWLKKKPLSEKETKVVTAIGNLKLKKKLLRFDPIERNRIVDQIAVFADRIKKVLAENFAEYVARGITIENADDYEESKLDEWKWRYVDGVLSETPGLFSPKKYDAGAFSRYLTLVTLLAENRTLIDSQLKRTLVNSQLKEWEPYGEDIFLLERRMTVPYYGYKLDTTYVCANLRETDLLFLLKLAKTGKNSLKILEEMILVERFVSKKEFSKYSRLARVLGARGIDPRFIFPEDKWDDGVLHENGILNTQLSGDFTLNKPKILKKIKKWMTNKELNIENIDNIIGDIRSAVQRLNKLSKKSKLRKKIAPEIQVKHEELTKMIDPEGIEEVKGLLVLFAGIANAGEAGFIVDVFRHIEHADSIARRFVMSIHSKSISKEQDEGFKSTVLAALGSLVQNENSETKNYVVSLLKTVSSNSIEYPAYVRQGAVTALRKIGGEDAETAVRKAMEDPDMLFREVRIDGNASRESAVNDIVEEITWLMGEDRIKRDFPDLRENVGYIFDKNPKFIDFLQECPLRLFSVENKRKLDSVVLGDFRRYWFKIVGFIHYEMNSSGKYEETKRTIEIRSSDSPIDMSIMVELFANKYLLAAVIHHEFLHYIGILSEGEVLLKELNFLKSLIVEASTGLKKKDLKIFEKKLASAMGKIGITSIGNQLLIGPGVGFFAIFKKYMGKIFSEISKKGQSQQEQNAALKKLQKEMKEMLENADRQREKRKQTDIKFGLLETINEQILKLYGPDNIPEAEITKIAEGIITNWSAWITSRNLDIIEEQKLDPTKKMYEPLGAATKGKIRDLVWQSKNVKNILSKADFLAILKEEKSGLKKWGSYRKKGGTIAFANQLREEKLLRAPTFEELFAVGVKSPFDPLSGIGRFRHALRKIQSGTSANEEDTSLRTKLNFAIDPLRELVRATDLNSDFSRLSGIIQRNRKMVKMCLTVPIEVMRNSADMITALKKINAMGKLVSFKLTITGVEDQDVEMLKTLNTNSVKTALSFSENFTVDIITEAEIAERSALLGVKKEDALTRMRIIKDISLERIGYQVIPEGEYLAIVTEPTTEDKVEGILNALEAELQKNMSIKILIDNADVSANLFSFSAILNDWLENIQKGNASTVSMILPPIISSRDKVQQFRAALETSWNILHSV